MPQLRIETLRVDRAGEGRTHLVSPVVAAASAIKGTFAQESDL